MMTDSHSYLITSLDLHTMDLEDFKFGRTKITSLRIVDESSPEMMNIMGNWTKLTKRLNMPDVKKPNGILVRIIRIGLNLKCIF